MGKCENRKTTNLNTTINIKNVVDKFILKVCLVNQDI